MKRLVLGLVAASVVVALSSASAQETDATKSLAKCQKAVGKEVLRYGSSYQKEIGKCMDQITTVVIQRGEPIAGAASKCAKSFRNLVNTERTDKTIAAKMAANIGKACDPDMLKSKAVHLEADVFSTGGQKLDGSILAPWCENLGGMGSTPADLDDLDEWVPCLSEVATCGARQALATKYPRLLEWLNSIRGDILELDETCAGGACSACGDAAELDVIDACNALDAVEAAIDGATDDDLSEIACGPPTGGCGNGVVETGESCDGSDLNGETCGSLGYTAGAQLACTAQCRLNPSGCLAASVPSRFRNNGDLTATDVVSGLMWEIKDGASGIHNRNNSYTWNDGRTTFLNTLNSKCDDDEATDCTANGDTDCAGAPDMHASNDLCGHGGHRDWRLPTMLELKSLLPIETTCTTPPCVDPDLPGGAVSDGYWAANASSNAPQAAWFVWFFNGDVFMIDRTTLYRVRAVRGGL